MRKAETVPKLTLKNKIMQKTNVSCNLERVMAKPIAKYQKELEDINLNEYERIRTVGQGSFGIAVLYLRKSDNIKVVLKQINLSDLTLSERELAMNEANVFSKLHHPNIISYLGSFIRDNILLIEMEYADGGTLAQLITKQGVRDYFPERYVLRMFEQITSAINYMHCENILHRDLKTANIFLNRSNVVKVGDFGIAKVMDTKIHAQTVLGTPYYLSPEMCEGKEYDNKSDIWALGCILGEMCCLRKAFSATNLSELVTKIMSAHYIPLPSGYSTGIKTLLNLILQVDAHNRPSAVEILSYWLPLVYRNLGKNRGHIYEHKNDTAFMSPISTPQTADVASLKSITVMPTPISDRVKKRSLLYQMKSFGTSFSLTPIQLPSNLVIRNVAANGSHFVVVSEDGTVHVWGEGSKGQIGLSSLETWKHYPGKMDTMKNHHIVGACVGDEFTILWSDNGTAFSCGDNVKGCLGLGDQKNSYIPKLIESLISEHVTEISCGAEHVVALTKEGNIFTWGTSLCGALGLGYGESYVNLPQSINNLSTYNQVTNVFCGPDTTLLLLDNGEVYGCGSNSFNKLGFSSKVSKMMIFKKLPINEKVLSLSVSATHSVFLIEGGYVLTMGGNSEGQRGIGHTKPLKVPSLVNGIQFKYIKQVKCSGSYTVVCSEDNVITFWGTRYGIPDVNLNDGSNSAENCHSQIYNPSPSYDLGNSTIAFTNFLASVYKSELILDPIDILVVHSSKEQMNKGHYLNVSNIYPLSHSILVLVDTTVPLVQSGKRSTS